MSHSTAISEKKIIIYDFGSNNGDDIPYYLLKSDLVVAVEAVPFLANIIRRRFSNEIAIGKLIIENCVLTVGDGTPTVPFFINGKEHYRSQFPRPEDMKNFREVHLPSKNVIDLINKYGDPYYIKIDLEWYDQYILRHLFENNIKPPYISAESHHAIIYCLLVALGGYNSFKLVDGPSVYKLYKNHTISTESGPKLHTFPVHSAGPFGNDIAGPWMSDSIFLEFLSKKGLGWKDIHASRVDTPVSILEKSSYNLKFLVGSRLVREQKIYVENLLKF